MKIKDKLNYIISGTLNKFMIDNNIEKDVQVMIEAVHLDGDIRVSIKSEILNIDINNRWE